MDSPASRDSVQLRSTSSRKINGHRWLLWRTRGTTSVLAQLMMNSSMLSEDSLAVPSRRSMILLKSMTWRKIHGWSWLSAWRILSGPAVHWQSHPLKSYWLAERTRTETEKSTSSTQTARLGSLSTQWTNYVSHTSLSSSRTKYMWLEAITIWAVKSMTFERTSGASYRPTIRFLATRSTHSPLQLQSLTPRQLVWEDSESKIL